MGAEFHNTKIDNKKAEEKHKNVIQDMRDQNIETEWVRDSANIKDPFRFYTLDNQDAVQKLSPEGFLTITLPNYRLAVLWHFEINGQLSDGIWENYDWKVKSYWELQGATVQVDTSLDEAKADDPVDALQFKKHLTEFDSHVGRQIYYVRASGLDPNYTRKDLKNDLEKLDSLY